MLVFSFNQQENLETLNHHFFFQYKFSLAASGEAIAILFDAWLYSFFVEKLKILHTFLMSTEHWEYYM